MKLRFVLCCTHDLEMLPLTSRIRDIITPPHFLHRPQNHQYPPRRFLQSRPLFRYPEHLHLRDHSHLGRTPDSGSPDETHPSPDHL
jgi:hypothetical protein